MDLGPSTADSCEFGVGGGVPGDVVVDRGRSPRRGRRGRTVLAAILLLTLTLVAVSAGGVAAADGATTTDGNEVVGTSVAENETQPSSEFGLDDVGCLDGACGERVADTTEAPHASIVNVNVSERWDVGATGFLVEPDVVVTAAHVVSNASGNSYEPRGPDNFSVYPARNGEEKPYGEVDVEAVHYDERWFDESADADPTESRAAVVGDFAVLELAEPVGEETGTMDYARAEEAAVFGEFHEAAVAGYPNYLPFDVDHEENTQWTDTGTVEIEHHEGTPYLDAGAVGEDDGLEITNGHSGSPIYVDHEGDPTAVGLVAAHIGDSHEIVQGPAFTDRHVEAIWNASEYVEPDRFDVDIGEVEEPVGPYEHDVEVPVTVSNHEAGPADGDVEVTVDGTVVETVAVELEAGETAVHTVEVPVDPEIGGSVTIAAEGGTDEDVRTLDAGEYDPITGCIDAVCGERIEDTTEEPYDAVVEVRPNPEVDSSGSGVLVEPDVVVTAAHVVDGSARGKDEPRRIAPGNVTVYPARNGDETPYGAVGVEEIHYDERWLNRTTRLNVSDPDGVPADVAVLRLAEPVGHEAGTLEYATAREVATDGTIENVTAVGYPQATFFDVDEFLPDTMWADTGSVTVRGAWPETAYLDAGVVGEDDGLELFSGHSGGPVVAEHDGEPTVVGVVSAGDGFTGEEWQSALTPDQVAMIEDATAVEDRLDVELDTVRDPVPHAAEELTVGVAVENPTDESVTEEIDITLDGEVVETVSVSLNAGEERTVERTVPVDPTAGETIDLGVESATDADERTLDVAEPLDLTFGDGHEPQPAGADGLYRDLNGDGSVTNADVRLFFQHQHLAPIDDHPTYFDLTGNGDVGQDDVVALFEYVAGA